MANDDVENARLKRAASLYRELARIDAQAQRRRALLALAEECEAALSGYESSKVIKFSPGRGWPREASVGA